MTSNVFRTARQMRPAAGILLVAVVAAACAGSSTPAPAGTAAPQPTAHPASPVGGSAPPVSTPGSSGGPSGTFVVGTFRLAPGPDLCALLTANDFTSAGMSGAGGPTKNNPDPSDFYCVYAGKSSATGGIEFDAFIWDQLPTDDVAMGLNGFGNADVTAEVAGADKALYNDYPVPTIGVRSGNFDFLIGFPAMPDAHAAATALATLVLARAVALAH